MLVHFFCNENTVKCDLGCFSVMSNGVHERLKEYLGEFSGKDFKKLLPRGETI